MPRLVELSCYEKCRTQSGQYFVAMGNAVFQNELGCYVHPQDYEEECTLLPDWPHLSEFNNFRLTTKPTGYPHQCLIFETEGKFRFQVVMNDYRIVIPFRFKSTDPRIGTASAKWQATSGKILTWMVGETLRISYDKEPRLHVGNSIVIPSQT